MAWYDEASEGFVPPEDSVVRRQVAELGLTRYRYFPEPKEEFDPEDPEDMARYAEVLKKRYALLSYREPGTRKKRRRQRSEQERSASARIKSLKRNLATARAKLARWEGVRRACPRCARQLSLEQIRNKQRFCDETCRLEYIGSCKPRCRWCKALVGRNARGFTKLYCGATCRMRASALRRANRRRAHRVVVCGCCGKYVPQKKTGKVRAFCDSNCRQRYSYWIERPMRTSTQPAAPAIREGACLWCKAPIAWKTKPKKFCSDKCGSLTRGQHVER